MRKFTDKPLTYIKSSCRRLFVFVLKTLKKVGKGARLSYKKSHHHLAVRPHNHFVNKWKWYKRWHTWEKHQHVHFAVLGTYLLIVGVMLFNSYSAVNALSDLNNTWDFSDGAPYTLSNGLETSGSSVRMKAQNYSSDANTAALYHFDESSGATAYDSSSNSNDASVVNGTFGTGNLNNALSLNGLSSYASASDSASLSMTQANTLESWFKLNSSFSAGSTGQRQTIVDKGDYQLYLDNETGKVTYELADSTATGWTQVAGNDINGGWDLNGKRSVNALVKMGSDIYAGVGVDVGDAEVWKWDGTGWTLVGGGSSSVNSSWAAQTYEGVYALATDGTNLYAGLGITAGDGEVWKYNGTSWTKIGGDGINSGWAISTFEQVWTLDYYGGNLYAGLGSGANDAEVWKWNGTSWTKIGGDSVNSGWTTNYEIVGALTNDGTNLYAGLGTTAGDSEVWRWNGTSWTKIGGDSINSGWDTTIETVRSLRYFGTSLYAGLGDSAGDADVWSWNGTSWTKIGGDGANSSWAAGTYEQVGGFGWDGSNLYAGLGTGNGDGEVWSWNGTSWAKIGGDGANSSWPTANGDTVNTLLYDSGNLYVGTYDSAGSGWVYSFDGSNWTEIGGNYVNRSWGGYNMAAAQVMQTSGDYLYAGTGNSAGSALVWQWDGSSWTIVGGQGINNSWSPDKYEQVLSMASYQGHLMVGLGTTANGTDQDGEVWEWDGSTWTKIGGNGVNSSWNQASNYGEVDSLAADGTYLYAGLGAGSNNGEVWRWDGSGWTKIGGDSLNSGWTNYVENVYSLAFYNGKLYAGLGRSAGDSEVWEWNGTNLWTKIGGDAVNSSWGVSATIESVQSLMPYAGKLYAGLGDSTGDATLWEYDGSSWAQIGGDDVNSSWTSGTYEKVKTLVVYDGDLYAGLGNTAGDGEVWKFNDGVWTKLAGNGINSGWGNTIEEVESFSPYKGKLYAGTGYSANADAAVWSWGNNAYLESTTSTFDTGWHHIAATYDGTTMKIYIDGVLDASKTSGVSMPDSARPLLIGTSYGGREYGKSRGFIDGSIDELRISNVARTSFTNKPYSTSAQTVTLNSPVRTSGVWTWDDFVTYETLNGGAITYRLSIDGGTTWQYWDGSSWATSNSTTDSNTALVVDAHISTLGVSFGGITWQAVLTGDGDQQVTLNSLSLDSTSDTTEPDTNASNISALKAAGGSTLTQNAWTNGGSPYFEWDSGSDTESGVLGYCLYLGTDNSADPVTTKGVLGTSPVATGNNCQFIVDQEDVDTSIAGYIGTALTTSDTPYYLIVKAIDKAGNVSSASAQFYFKFDNTPPDNPGYVTAPSGYINTKTATLTWPTTGGGAPDDDNSGLAGLQYRINNSTWYGDDHTGTGSSDDLLVNDGSYTTQTSPDFSDITEGVNTVYFRAWDQAGNVTSTYVTAALKVNTSSAPSAPLGLTPNPSSNTLNAFSFSWFAPSSFVGNENALTYCYTFNVLPAANTCIFTSAGITSLGNGAYATQPDINTIYVVAKDESGNINYSNYAEADFSANTTAPGIPRNADIVDVSIKSTSNWRLALTWDEPTDEGAGIAAYKVYRSIDDSSYSFVGSSSSTTYIDAGLTQVTYYYKVKACDSTNNCGEYSTVVSELPTGKFTSPATLVAEPSVSNVTTRKARVSWSTDRPSDSKIAIGTASNNYSPSEIGNSDQVSSHQIDLDNLAAGTTYYYVAKWTDEDGNTGTSQEYVFTTSPAPSLKEITAINVGLSSATIQFTSKDAYSVSIYFGKSDAFGGVQKINTSATESTYSVQLTGLDDGAKYFYKLVSEDNEGNTYDGSINSFTTPARPRISNLRFQPVSGEPTSTQQVSWTTNVPSTTQVSYGIVGGKSTDSQVSDLVTDHQIIIRGLEDDSEYSLIAQSRDDGGNLAVSDTQTFHTALDTRPPKITSISVEPSIRGVGAEARGQVVVSWHTDEPSTSQVAYAEGSSASVFNSKTSEDSSLSTEHVVIVSDLPTSRVYTIQPVSRDRAGNAGTGDSQPAIIGRASDSVLTIVLNTLRKVFGF